MAQFYFLSVLLNVLCGLILVYGTNLASGEIPSSDAADTGSEEKSLKDGFKGFDNKTFRLIIGILSVFVGILKFLSVYRNDIPVIGDLLPALAGLMGGASILLEYFMGTTTEEINIPEAVKKIFIECRKYIGVGCLVVGVLHFIFPQVPIL